MTTLTPTLDEATTYQPSFEKIAVDHAFDSAEPAGLDLLDQIDETLDLIAQAQAPAMPTDAVEHIDVSIIIAVHNARETLPDVLDRIEEVMPPSCEVVIVDDGSTDGSFHYVRGLGPSKFRKVIRRRQRHGRASAIRLAIRHTRGRVVAIQDADMAYDPADLLGNIWPILECQADVVYGSRRLRKDTRRGVGIVARLSNRITTFVSNRVTGLRLSDLESSHKAFRGDLLRSLNLTERDRGFDAEVTAKVAKRADVVMEVPTRFEGDLLDHDLASSPSNFWQTLRSLIAYGGK